MPNVSLLGSIVPEEGTQTTSAPPLSSSSDIIEGDSSVIGSAPLAPVPSATSIPIPAQFSIPVQFQNGHMGMGQVELSQHMSELDLNMQCPSPLPSVTSSAGVNPRHGFVDYSPQMSRSRGGLGGQNITGAPPVMYSENYPQGALYLSNPMLASWHYNPNQGIK